MKLAGKTIGVGFTGSFCTYEEIFPKLKDMVLEGANVYTVFSNASQHIDCRFGKSEDFINKAYEITGNKPILTLETAEPIGPENKLDVFLIAPCTGNTAAKLSLGITDSPVLMAAKAHLRNKKPLVLSIATNDALSFNLKTIGVLLNSKNIYFVPFGQDNYKAKPNSMTARCDLIIPTLEIAMEKEQLQPIIQAPK